MISLLDSLISLEKIGSLKELVQRIAITIKTWLKLELPSSKISSYLVRDGDTDHYAMIFFERMCCFVSDRFKKNCNNGPIVIIVIIM